MINREFENEGLCYFTLPKKRGNGSDISNTYALNTGNRWYIIDTSCGRKRYKELKYFLNGKKDYTILCTHYHNDHVANNGRVKCKTGNIFYHPDARPKVRYLRTNATGQILTMYRKLGKKGFLQRMGYFNERFINFMLKRKITSECVMIPLLFIVSYLFSVATIGRINGGGKRVKYFNKNEKVKIRISGFETDGWKIEDEFYAIETPGHTDCHLMYYYRPEKILFTGDSLNFLTPNDIQFGDLNSTIDSQKMIYRLVDQDKISLICQGHYAPIKNNRTIIEYVKDTINKHEHVNKLIRDSLNDMNINLPFDELYKKICGIDDPVIRKLAKITFPGSTLVFLDVYLYKIINDIKHNTATIHNEKHSSDEK